MNYDPLNERPHIIQDANSAEAVKKRKETFNKTYFPSRFSFLNCHRGLRPGYIHGLISPMGAGKSTIFKTVIADTCMNARALVWLSEETSVDYQMGIEITGIPRSKINDNLVFAEERKANKSYLEKLDFFVEYMNEQVVKSMCDVLFIDNITTSKIYDGSFGVWTCSQAAAALREIAERNNIPVFYLAHTKKEVTRNFHRLLTNEDIRSGAHVAIQSEFMYLMNYFCNQENISNIIQVSKHRGYKTPAGYFRLEWLNGMYVKDTAISFDSVKKIFKERNVL